MPSSPQRKRLQRAGDGGRKLITERRHAKQARLDTGVSVPPGHYQLYGPGGVSIAGKTIATEFGLSPIQLGYLFSSFLWTYVICLIPMGIIVDRFGTRLSMPSALPCGRWQCS